MSVECLFSITLPEEAEAEVEAEEEEAEEAEEAEEEEEEEEEEEDIQYRSSACSQEPPCHAAAVQGVAARRTVHHVRAPWHPLLRLLGGSLLLPRSWPLLTLLRGS